MFKTGDEVRIVGGNVQTGAIGRVHGRTNGDGNHWVNLGDGVKLLVHSRNLRLTAYEADRREVDALVS